MLTITLATLRHQSRRLLAPLLAVVLGVGFLAATSTFAASAKASMTSHAAGSFADVDLVAVAEGVTPGSAAASASTMPADLPEQLRAVPGVADVHAARHTIAQGVAGGRATPFAVHSPPGPQSGARLTEGRWPATSGETVVAATLARMSGLTTGEELSIGERRLTVVGIADVSADTRYVGLPVAFAVPADVSAIGDRPGWDEIDVTVAPGADVTEVQRAVAAAAGGDVTVRTGTATADAVVADLGQATDMLGLMLRAFGLVALVVTAMVIGNTFAILLARRHRETAMLRAVGASRRQVLRSAVAEGSLLGLVGGLLGALGGSAVAALLVVLLDRTGAVGMPMEATIGWAEIVVPVLVGIIVVVLAVLRPALAASRVSPLEAMRPAATPRGRQAARGRTVLGAVATIAGLALLAAGSLTNSLVVAMAGGAVSFVGVVATAPALVPAVAGALGRLVARPAGLTAEIATENVRRNPARSAATAMALLVGVTLVTMTMTAAATAQRSVTAQIDETYPVDGVVAVSEGSVPDEALADLRGAAPVEQVSLLRGGTTDVSGREMPVVAADRHLSTVVRDGSGSQQVAPGTVRVPEDLADSLDSRSGSSLVVGARTLQVVVGPVPAPGLMVAEEDLTSVVPDAAPVAALVRLSDDVAAEEAGTQVAEALREHPTVSWSSSAQMRAELERSLDVALAVVLGMLAMSVLIAVVGIANTLSLSAHERSRESALMRALGVTRVQLRRVVALEAVLMALTGTVLGGLLGVAYGLGGASALIGGSVDVVPALPWWQMALVALVATGAGLAASVLPAARAAQVSPASALAGD